MADVFSESFILLVENDNQLLALGDFLWLELDLVVVLAADLHRLVEFLLCERFIKIFRFFMGKFGLLR